MLRRIFMVTQGNNGFTGSHPRAFFHLLRRSSHLPLKPATLRSLFLSNGLASGRHSVPIDCVLIILSGNMSSVEQSIPKSVTLERGILGLTRKLQEAEDKLRE